MAQHTGAAARRLGAMRVTLPLLQVALAALAACPTTAAWAQGHAHVHGEARLEVVLDGAEIQISLLAPLDSIVGFEHRPRTAAQRQAAEAALRVLADPASLVGLPAAAGCNLTDTQLHAPVLAPAGASAPQSGHTDPHADLDANWRFQCAAPDRLDRLRLRLFEHFAPLKRLEVRTAGPVGQARQLIRRGGAAEIRLKR